MRKRDSDAIGRRCQTNANTFLKFKSKIRILSASGMNAHRNNAHYRRRRHGSHGRREDVVKGVLDRLRADDGPSRPIADRFPVRLFGAGRSLLVIIVTID